MTLPDIGDSVTATNPASTECSGAWAVTDVEGTYKADDAFKVTYTIGQWYNGSTYFAS